ncbi:MAG: NDP-sugar synthase [Solirubrobacterales bacterium]|nr:NDP-sugar synthase [Solirubrobacterales bacterium]
MQAVVLVGGQGTRLRPLTDTVPKPVLPLAGKPFIVYMVEWLAEHGVEEIVFSLGFLAEDMKRALAGIDRPRLIFAEEPGPRGTAGAIKFCEEMDLLEDRFLALNGDVLADLDLSALIAEHERSGARATLALYPVDDPTGYGLVRRADDGQVLEFLEKPEPGHLDTDEINAGAYVLERSVLDPVAEGEEVSIEREVFPRLVGDGLYGLRLDGYWMDIGTPERFMRASDDILRGRVRTSTGDALGDDGLLVDPGANVATDAIITPPALIGEGAVLEAGATVEGPVVVGARSTVGESSTLAGSILFEECGIGAGAMVGRAILAEGAEVSAGAVVADGEVVGPGEVVGRETPV